MKKTIIARALPLTQKYKLLSVSHLDDFCQCENCGRPITNVATLQADKTYFVGLDCMDTLLENSSLLDNDSYMEYMWSAVPALSKAKSLRAKILKNKKKNPTYSATLKEFPDGNFGFSFEQSYSWRDGTEPLGWDYTFNPTYKELTLAIVKGLYDQ